MCIHLERSDSFTLHEREEAHLVRELWEEVDCKGPETEQVQAIKMQETNRRIPKFDRGRENIYSAKGSDGA